MLITKDLRGRKKLLGIVLLAYANYAEPAEMIENFYNPSIEWKPYIRFEAGHMVFNKVGDSDALNQHVVSKAQILGAGLGIDYDRTFKAEISLVSTPKYGLKIKKASGTTSSHVSHLAALLNLYYFSKDFDYFLPYFFAGMGFSNNKLAQVKDYDLDSKLINIQNNKSKTSRAWDVGAGLSFKINPYTEIDLGYRYLNYGATMSADSGIYGEDHPSTPNIKHTDAKYRYHFSEVRSQQGYISLRIMLY